MAAPRSRLRSGRFWRQFAQLQLGLLMFGVGIGLMLRADLGLDPWSTFHEGLALRVGLSFGRVSQSVGVLFVAVGWLWLRERPGLGTVCNMLLVGPWVDLLRPQMSLATLLGAGFVAQLVQFLVGLAIVGTASGLYIAARLGAGPRDTFILGVSRRFGVTVRRTRIGLELLVLAIGWSIGGPVGLGTVLFALLMGPLMQASLRVFRYEHAQVAAPAGAVAAAPDEPPA